MTDSTNLDLDMREFCARILQEYEEVISIVIQRPIPPLNAEPGAGVGIIAIDGTVPSEPA